MSRIQRRRGRKKQRLSKVPQHPVNTNQIPQGFVLEDLINASEIQRLSYEVYDVPQYRLICGYSAAPIYFKNGEIAHGCVLRDGVCRYSTPVDTQFVSDNCDTYKSSI